MAVYMIGAMAGKIITKIAAAGFLSLYLSTDNKLFSCGHMSYYYGASLVSIGAGAGINDYRSAPFSISITTTVGNRTIVDFKASQGNVHILTSDGLVFSLGANLNYTVRLSNVLFTK